MPILIVCIGSHGDVHPFVGLGQTLQSRGHDVTLTTSDYFRPLVERAGLRFIPNGSAEEFMEVASNPDLWDARRGPEAVFGQAVKRLDRFHDTVANWIRPDGQSIVVASSLGLGVRVAREHLAFRHVTVHLSPVLFRSIHEPPHFPTMIPLRWLPSFVLKQGWAMVDRKVIDPIVAPELNAYRAKFGLAPVSRIIHDWWNSPDLVLGLFPEWFAAKQPDWPASTVLTGFPLYDEQDIVPLSPALQQFINSGSPPIAFTPGSAMLNATYFFQSAIDACAAIGQRGILLTRHKDQLPAHIPPHMLHVDYAPFSLLLKHCAATVHHGGIGSTAQGLAAGIPQLIMPLAHDQHDNANRLKRLGVGDELSPKKFKPKALAKKLNRLLTNKTIRQTARNLATRVNQDALQRAAEAIEAMQNTRQEPRNEQ